MTTQTAYAVLFRNEDGTLRGTAPGKTPECAVKMASPLAGDHVFGLATIRVEPEPITGMRFVLREVGPNAKPEAIPALTTSPSPQADKARGAMEAIIGLSRSLRFGGPAPEDLQELSDSLEQAVGIASDALKFLPPTPQPQGDASPSSLAIEQAALYGWTHASWDWEAVRGGLDRFTSGQVSGSGEVLSDDKLAELANFHGTRSYAMDGKTGCTHQGWSFRPEQLSAFAAALSAPQARPDGSLHCPCCNAELSVNKGDGGRMYASPCPKCTRYRTSSEPAPTADVARLVEALADAHGGDHHDDECPVCVALAPFTAAQQEGES